MVWTDANENANRENDLKTTEQSTPDMLVPAVYHDQIRGALNLTSEQLVIRHDGGYGEKGGSVTQLLTPLTCFSTCQKQGHGCLGSDDFCSGPGMFETSTEDHTDEHRNIGDLTGMMLP
jgi:hypothetical protein